MKTDKSWLPPPQIYELSRLINEPDIDKLLPFARKRGMNSPTTLFFPIQYQMSDGLLNCYPGDDLYPKELQLSSYSTTEHDVNQYKDKTCEESRVNASNLHRAEQKSLSDVQIWQNIELPDNHLSAQTAESPKPKL